MFAVTGDFPLVQPVSLSGAPISSLGSVVTLFTGAPTATATAIQNPAIESFESTVIPAYSGNTITVAVPVTSGGDEVGNVNAVSINGSSYTLEVPDIGPGGSSNAGTFAFDPDTQELTITLREGEQPAVGSTVEYIAIANKAITLTDRYTRSLDAILTQWNVAGVISCTRGLEQSPSGTIAFNAPTGQNLRSFTSSVLQALPAGTKIVINDHGYSVASVATAGRQFTIQLQGAHDEKLGTAVKLRSTTGAGVAPPSATSGGFIIASQSSGEGIAKSYTSVPLSAIASRAGVPYVGPSISIRVDKDTPLRAGTTLGNELGRSRSVEGFAFYSNPDAIEIRKWVTGRTIHRLSKSDILSSSDEYQSDDPIQRAYNVSGNLVGGDRLAEEYLNRELRIDSSGQNQSSNGRTNVRRKLFGGNALNGSLVLYTPPPNVDRGVPNNSFDLGGPTKTFTIQEFFNGVLVSNEETTHGYFYSCKDSYSFAGLNPYYDDNQPRLANYGEVRSIKEAVRHDSDGYEIGRTATVKQKRRFRQETKARETLALKQQDLSEPTPLNTALMALYDFFDAVEIDEEENTLKNLRDYYPDVPTPSDGDPEPRFILRKQRRKFANYKTPDPESTPEEPKAELRSGTDFTVEVFTNIIEPVEGVSKDRYDPTKDAYQIEEEIGTAEGEELSLATKEATITPYLGRPSPAPRLEIFEEGDEPTPDDEDENENILLLRTPNTGLTNSDVIDGSISFPGGYTKATALDAATVDISILNSQQVEVWQVKVAANRIYSEGDLVSHDGDVFVVLTVNETIQIQGVGHVTAPFWELTWGKLITPDVTLSQVQVEG